MSHASRDGRDECSIIKFSLNQTNYKVHTGGDLSSTVLSGGNYKLYQLRFQVKQFRIYIVGIEDFILIV